MIYFDNAATTLQKPPEVARAVARTINTAASPGRGGHGPGMRGAEILFSCRELAARLFGVDDPQRVILTSNATHGLNIAVQTLVRPGSSVVISGYEHNAVTRPLAAVPNVKISVAASELFDRRGAAESFARLLDHRTVSAVFCNHVSNVFGFALPAEEIAAMCREREIPFVLDASQSAGILPVSMSDLGAAFIAMPGHKGLYGPQGTGLLLCGEQTPQPILYGGTGSASMLQEMPEFLPDRLEAGTHNVCGAAGLLEGMRFVAKKGIGRIAEHERRLNRRLMDGLSSMSRIRVYRGEPSVQTGVCSFQAEGMDSEEVATVLARHGVAVRAGLHCSPLAHRTVGTVEKGTVRVSFSVFNTGAEVDRFLDVIQRGLK